MYLHTTTTLTLLTALPAILASPYPYRRSYGTPISHGPFPTSTAVILPSAPYCPPQAASEAVQRAIFNSFVQTLYIEKNVTAAFESYIAIDLIEHDPFDAQGRAANEAKLSQIIPFVPSTVLSHAFENNTGFIHVRVDEEAHSPIALADIYRMNGTCLVEHWDVTQETPRNATNVAVPFT